ncbi:hypothetical protein FQ330_03200 [Agrococcus sediminis]|uniref:Uncharacterized protein n=1 Tax=Agrococcus sediminis TaxID=2599924 RepID=A0A5M8QK01_9MICO|nr:hypothetical protein [Agrococcus sediminis]KAA6436425.1 hypothetical protein FQ330_03200 [Agrococcus sediminis]
MEGKPSLTPQELAELREGRAELLQHHPEKRNELFADAFEAQALTNTVAWQNRVQRLGSKLPRDTSAEERDTHREAQKAKLSEMKSAKNRVPLTVRERQAFVEEAREAGMTPGALFRLRMRSPLGFLPVAAAQLPQKQHTSSNGGRPPSEAGNLRNSPLDFRLTKAETAALEETAAHYRLSASDFARSLITGTDPRISWGHIGSGGPTGGRAAARLAYFEGQEEGHENPLDAYEGHSTAEWLTSFEEQNLPAAEKSVEQWLEGDDKEVSEEEQPQVSDREQALAA